MPEYQPVSSVRVAEIERPRCPSCNHNRMLLSKLESGPSGIGCCVTFECRGCGRVQTTVIPSDPMASGRGWLASELKPPT